MAKETHPSRSYKRLTRDDLERLRKIEANVRAAFVERNPRYKALSQRVLCVALCQGAALHWLDGKNGVKDFDVWTFYAALPGIEFPSRWRAVHDFGDAKFGQSDDSPDYIGRRVDLLGRSLPVKPGSDPVSVIRHYLATSRTSSARHLSQKAVVLLEPKSLQGKVVWPVEM